ncbi:MAG: GntR family transcriptional regulator [Clostridia bacterium]|nr:GntR family transcriptional regulator [Clostridia bacterium]
MYYKNVKDDVVSGLPLAINIFIKLRDDILQGKLKDGEKLTEQRICNEYNVSRTPVREAFRLLEQEGLINMIPNRGAFVTGFTERDISDMYEMRKVYEELAFKWATERITEEELEEIKNGYELMEFYTHKKDEEKVTQQNFYFHELIYRASHNRMLTQILTSFQYYTKQFNSAGGVDPETDNIERMLEEHYEILQALEKRDSKHGVEIVKRHLEMAKERAGYGDFQKEDI